MTTAQKPLYKVLRDGRSCHGGDLAWSLPVSDGNGGWTPGEWHSISGRVKVCEDGLHLTNTPSAWVLPHHQSQCYLAETDDPSPDWSGDKCAVRRARLLRPVEWSEVGVHYFTTGAHEITEGIAYASGSARVRASGSASVRASGSASVRASDSASVTAYGSASVTAYGSARVEASGSASVTSTRYHGAASPVVVEGGAVHVDRRGAVLVLRTACAARLETATPPEASAEPEKQ